MLLQECLHHIPDSSPLRRTRLLKKATQLLLRGPRVVPNDLAGPPSKPGRAFEEYPPLERCSTSVVFPLLREQLHLLGFRKGRNQSPYTERAPKCLPSSRCKRPPHPPQVRRIQSVKKCKQL